MQNSSLTAKLAKPEQSNARNMEPEKERVGTLTLVAKVSGKLQTVCEARFYMARRSDGASPVYCSIWVHGKTMYVSGFGKAGGYGYHKQSAALQHAITSAGFELYGDVYGRDASAANKRAYIDGVGESAMRAAMLAIAKLAGANIKLHHFA